MTLQANFIYVHGYLNGSPELAGTFAHDGQSGSFTYSDKWLSNGYCLDPENLRRSSAPATFVLDKGVPGVFQDCCPQEWGVRMLQLLHAGESQDDVKALLVQSAQDPITMLMLASGYGAGCLRFAFDERVDAVHLEPASGDAGVADIHRLDELAQAVMMAERMTPLTSEQRAMIIPGLSLGGARPKALIVDDGVQWIAKFRRPNEAVDIQRVEQCMNYLARNAGIRTADFRVEVAELEDGLMPVFMSRRFDRSADGTPRHYISAASLLGISRRLVNGRLDAQQQADFGYADLAALIRKHSFDPSTDLGDLYRRMVLNILMGNRDDHLCNHGFLLSEEAPNRYELAPAFDLALSPNGDLHHSIAIAPGSRVGSLDAALKVAPHFGLSKAGAKVAIDQVRDSCSIWGDVLMEAGGDDFDREWVNKLVHPDFREMPRAPDPFFSGAGFAGLPARGPT